MARADLTWLLRSEPTAQPCAAGPRCCGLEIALAAVAAVSAVATLACGRPESAPAAASDVVAVEKATVDSLQQAMESGALTSRRLVETYLRRIETLGRQGPALRSVLET